MAIPLIVNERVFNAVTTSTTTALSSLNPEFGRCVSIIYEVKTLSFGGTLDFQAAAQPGGDYTNVSWVAMDDEKSADVIETDNQIRYDNDTDTHRYLVPLAGALSRVVMTRYTGTVTVTATGYGVYLPPERTGLITALTGASRVDLSVVAGHLSRLVSLSEDMLGELRKHSDAMSEWADRDLDPSPTRTSPKPPRV